MSFDLYVLDGEVPDDEVAIGELLEDSGRWDSPLTPALAELVAELERGYPSIDDDPDNSPWATWPLTQSMLDGHCCGLNIVWSHAQRLSADIRTLCVRRHLTLYDPQEGRVLRPGAAATGAPPKRRRWFRG